MTKKESGFTMMELLIVILILGVLAAFSLPRALTSLKSYRMHADGTQLASYMNFARMRSASQYAPYRVVLFLGTGTYTLEHLCGQTPTSGAGSDANCISAYNPFTAPKYELGTQYALLGNTFLACRPTGIPAASSLNPSPGTITADASGCPGSPATSLFFYFNTRGLPVDSTGNPLASGGAVVYIKNQSGLVDAVTVSLGGRVAVWNWDSTGAQWYMR